MNADLIISGIAVAVSVCTTLLMRYGVLRSENATRIRDLEATIERQEAKIGRLEARIDDLENENVNLLRRLMKRNESEV